MINTNLATRPFYNDTAVRAWIGVVALVVIAFSAFNIVRLVSYSQNDTTLARQAGKQVVVVVSARGDTTDELIELAQQISERPPAREMDMLLSTGEQISIALMAMAIQQMGQPAISFTGAQVGCERLTARQGSRSSAATARGWLRGARYRSPSPATPSARQRSSHL